MLGVPSPVAGEAVWIGLYHRPGDIGCPVVCASASPVPQYRGKDPYQAELVGAKPMMFWKFLDGWTCFLAGVFAATACIGVILSYRAFYVLYVYIAMMVAKSGSIPVVQFHFWMIFDTVVSGVVGIINLVAAGYLAVMLWGRFRTAYRSACPYPREPFLKRLMSARKRRKASRQPRW